MSARAVAVVVVNSAYRIITLVLKQRPVISFRLAVVSFLPIFSSKNESLLSSNFIIFVKRDKKYI